MPNARRARPQLRRSTPRPSRSRCANRRMNAISSAALVETSQIRPAATARSSSRIGTLECENDLVELRARPQSSAGGGQRVVARARCSRYAPLALSSLRSKRCSAGYRSFPHLQTSSERPSSATQSRSRAPFQRPALRISSSGAGSNSSASFFPIFIDGSMRTDSHSSTDDDEDGKEKRLSTGSTTATPRFEQDSAARGLSLHERLPASILEMRARTSRRLHLRHVVM